MRITLPIFFLLVLATSSCNKDPEPEPTPEENQAFITLYNFLSEPFEVKWEVDEVEHSENQPYGAPLSGSVFLDKDSEDILFVVKRGDSGAILESHSLQMTRKKHYMALVLGTAENPVLLCEELETAAPSPAHVHTRFLHAAVDEQALDIYMGGSSSEKKVLSGLDYGTISSYHEVSEYDVRASVIVTLHDTIYKEENQLLIFEYNDLIQVNNNYFSVLAPSSNTEASDLTLWLYVQPKE